MSKKTALCVKHGGKPEDFHQSDAFWYCAVCSCEGIAKCKCGGVARFFGEALMSSVSCDDCDESVGYLGFDKNAIDLWNSGIRDSHGSEEFSDRKNK